MTQKSRFIAALLALALSARVALAETLGDGWLYRRPVDVTAMISDAPGENIAWVEFYANGTQQADGSDLRVTTADRTLVPHRLMQISAGADLVRLAFATKGNGPYFVWWGNPKAEMPAQPLEIRRGVLLEMTRLEPGPGRIIAPARGPATTRAATASGPAAASGPASAPATRGALPARVPAAVSSSTSRLLASYLLPNLGLAYNPLSDQRQVVCHYSASFKIDPAITARFQLAGGNGTLEIDGKSATSGRPGQPGSVTLAAGWHTLDIHSTSPTLTLSWQRPDEKTFTAFPAALLAPVARGSAGSLQRADGAPLVDISPEPAAEIPLAPGSFAQRYTFEASFPDTLKPTLQWSFADGQSAADLRKVSHIFLSPGIYPVSVKLQTGGGTSQETTVRIAIKERMWERMPKPPVDAPATVRAILKEYNLERLRPEDAWGGMAYFESIKDADLQIAWAHAWLTGRETFSVPIDEMVARETAAVARLQSRQKNYRAAAEVFRLAAAKPIGMETRIDLIRHEVMVLCDDVNDAPAGLEEAEAWLTRIVASNAMQARTAQVALAYALIATGDGKGAKAAIDGALAPAAPAGAGTRGAVAPPPATGRGPATAPDASATWRPRVAEALAKKDWDGAATLVDQWELADPASLWTGASRVERGKLLAADHRYLDAARIAMQHVRANPEGLHAAELLFEAAGNFRLGGDPAQAQAALDQLRREHPDSAEARQDLPR